jgi:hypothetical protein
MGAADRIQKGKGFRTRPGDLCPGLRQTIPEANESSARATTATAALSGMPPDCSRARSALQDDDAMRTC